MAEITVSMDELVEDQVRGVITSMVTQMDTGNLEAAASWISEDALFIRPTGNPLTKATWVAMLNSPDVKVVSNKVLDFHRVDVNPSKDWAYLCYTTHAKFNYKGTENDDVSVFSVVVKHTDAGWKLSYLQRSTGRLPTDEMPSFN